MSTTSVKAVMLVEYEEKTGRQTFSNVNAQAADAKIAEALQLLGTLQKGTIKEMQKVATTVLTA